MAQVDIGDAAMAGVRLTFRRPLVVITWGALASGFMALLLVLFSGAIISAIQSIVRLPTGQSSAEQVLGLVGSLFGLGLLMFLGIWVINSVLMAAAIRCELEPNNKGFAYLRFGAQELWLMAVTFVLAVVNFIFQSVISIPIQIAVATLGGFGGGADMSVGKFGASVAVGLVGQILVTSASIWFWLRLSLGPVLSFRDRQFRLFESWELTKGHAWRMFLALLVVFAMSAVVYVVLWTIGGMGAFIMIANAPELNDLKTFFAKPPAEWLATFAPLLVFLFVVGVVLFGVLNAWTWTTVARIYHQLNPDADVASTFT